MSPLQALACADFHEIQAERCEREAMRWRNRMLGRTLGLLREASAHRDKAGRCWAEASA
jgi:hypothetical protein